MLVASNHWRFWGALLLASALLFSGTGVQAVADSIADVNGHPISRQIFQIYYRPQVEKFSAQGNPINEAYLRNLRKYVIEDLIDSELLLQEARKLGIEVTDEILNESIENDRSQYADEEQFRAELRKYGLGIEDYRQRRRRALTIEKLIATHIAPDVFVSDADIRAYYRRHAERFRVPERLHIHHITLRFPPDAGDDQKESVRERIVAIQRQIEAGEDFAELAHKHSEDPSRQQGGDAGFRAADQVARKFGQAVLELPTGRMSPPIQTPQGYHLVIVAAREPARNVPLDKVRARINRELYEQRTREPIQAYVRKLRERARIVIHE